VQFVAHIVIGLLATASAVSTAKRDGAVDSHRWGMLQPHGTTADCCGPQPSTKSIRLMTLAKSVGRRG